MSEPRIFVDDEPESAGGTGPWLLVVAAALIVAAATLLLSGRQPGDDQAFVQLPVPSTSSTTTSTIAPTTTTTEQPLILQTWVPSFDRTLRLVGFDERTLSVTSWRPGVEPSVTTHAIGAISWADFDAAGNTLAAISFNTNGQHVVWLGTSELLEPVLISEDRVSAAFHSDVPGLLAIASSSGEATQIATYAASSRGELIASDSVEIDGDLGLGVWSSAGFLLWDVHDPNLVTWATIDGTTQLVEAYVPPQSGGALLYGDRTAQGFRSSTLWNDELIELPEGTVSVSPQGRYAVIDAPFNVQLYDLARDVGVPLTDGVGFVADWSSDDRWFVYVSDIDSYRRGELTRYVFVDTQSGGSVSVSISAGQIAAPHILTISD